MRRVLVIESDEGLLRAIARNLRVHGFAVSTASSVGEGLCMLEGQDVVVVDLTLPDAHGAVVLRKIRRENWPIRVAFLWDAEDSTALAEAEALKPDFIIHKLEIDRLLKWVAQLLARSAPVNLISRASRPGPIRARIAGARSAPVPCRLRRTGAALTP